MVKACLLIQTRSRRLLCRGNGLFFFKKNRNKNAFPGRKPFCGNAFFFVLTELLRTSGWKCERLRR